MGTSRFERRNQSSALIPTCQVYISDGVSTSYRVVSYKNTQSSYRSGWFFKLSHHNVLCTMYYTRCDVIMVMTSDFPRVPDGTSVSLSDPFSKQILTSKIYNVEQMKSIHSHLTSEHLVIDVWRQISISIVSSLLRPYSKNGCHGMIKIFENELLPLMNVQTIEFSIVGFSNILTEFAARNSPHFCS